MAGIIVQGTTFKISDDNVTFEDLGCVQSFNISGGGRTEIDTTCIGSTSKEFKLGLKDNGTVSVEILYNASSAGQALVDSSYDSNDAYYFEVVYTDTSTITKTFQGFVMNQSLDNSVDEVVRQTIEIKITGEITTVVS